MSRPSPRTSPQNRTRGSENLGLDLSAEPKWHLTLPSTRRDRLTVAGFAAAAVVVTLLAVTATSALIPHTPAPRSVSVATHAGAPALGPPEISATGLGVHPLPTPAPTPGAAATTMLNLTQTASWHDPLVGVRALEVVATPAVAWHVVTAPLLSPQQVAAHESVTAIISCQTIASSTTPTSAGVVCLVDASDLWEMTATRDGRFWLVSSARKART